MEAFFSFRLQVLDRQRINTELTAYGQVETVVTWSSTRCSSSEIERLLNIVLIDYQWHEQVSTHPV